MANFCENVALAAPAVSSNIVILTRGELEILLLQSFEKGMAAATKNINQKQEHE